MFAIIMAVFVLILIGPFTLALLCTLLVGTLELCNKMLFGLDRLFAPRERNTYIHIENQYVYQIQQKPAAPVLKRSQPRPQYFDFGDQPKFNRFGDQLN
jgi:hypothetical protein